MVSLTVRNISETVLRHIRFYATGSRRSVNSELLLLLEEGLAARAREAIADRPATFSSTSREILWKELCGAWEEEEVPNCIESVYRLRSGKRRNETDDSI